MSAIRFLKNNFVLVIGLALPFLLMVGFMLAASLPASLSDPPEYDLVFAVPDSDSYNLPVFMKLTVDQDGALKAQITPVHKRDLGYGNWKKLYLFEAATQKVRELPLPYPADMEKITETMEFVVESTSGMKLDTTTESPDGYVLSYAGYSSSGLIGELFIGNRYNSEPRLRKGGNSVPLITNGNKRSYFSYGSIEFIGWVTDK
ncbi:MAG TPA: hypothetical protein VIK69_02505 [Methylophilaceae bacterium]|jgi:hypothetical protein